MAARKIKKASTCWTLRCKPGMAVPVGGLALTADELCRRLAKYGIEKTDTETDSKGRILKVWLADRARHAFIVGIVPFPKVNGTVSDFALANEGFSEEAQRLLAVIGAVCHADLVPFNRVKGEYT